MGCRFAWILTSQVQRRPLLLLACVGYPQFLWRPNVTHTDDEGCHDDDRKGRYIGQHRQQSTVDIRAPRLKLKLHGLNAPEQKRSDESVEGIPHGKDHESDSNPPLPDVIPLSQYGWMQHVMYAPPAPASAPPRMVQK